jgi:predicted metal-binding protein
MPVNAFVSELKFMNRHAIEQYIKDLGATHCQFIASELLIAEERIRQYCHENRCGCYDRHLMCPPRTGTLTEITVKFKRFNTGILVQYSKRLDVKNDRAGLMATKRKLHDIILETEDFLREQSGITAIFGMIGGDCGLCEKCAGFSGEVCVHPDKARPSLEALGVDVIGLLNTLSLDGRFHEDQITWTAMVLIAESRRPD